MGKSLFDDLDREWASLTESAASQRAFDKWNLAGVSDLADFVSQVQNRDDHQRSDGLLYRTVERACRDDLACRAVLHCMMPAMRSLAWRYRSTASRLDVESSVITETLDKIRNYPIDRRPRHIAANIARDVHQVFWRGSKRTTELVAAEGRLRVPVAESSSQEEVLELIAESLWSGTVTRDDAALIFSTRVLDEQVNAIAEQSGLKPQSIRRRRLRAEIQLRQVAETGGC